MGRPLNFGPRVFRSSAKRSIWYFVLLSCCRGLAYQRPNQMLHLTRRAGRLSEVHLHARGAFGDKAMNDPIVDEVRRVRDAHAAMFNYDLDAIFRDIKEQEKGSGLKFVTYPPRRMEPHQALEPAGTATSVSPDSMSPEATPSAEL